MCCAVLFLSSVFAHTLLLYKELIMIDIEKTRWFCVVILCLIIVASTNTKIMVGCGLFATFLILDSSIPYNGTSFKKYFKNILKRH
jgi:hypothetical protein